MGQALKLRHALIALFHMRWMGVESELTQQDRADYQRLCLPESPEFMLHIFPGDMHRIPFASASFSFVYSYNAIFFMTKSDIARSMDEIERVLKPGGVCYVNFKSVDDPDREPFCETAFARRLLNSERFSASRGQCGRCVLAGF